MTVPLDRRYAVGLRMTPERVPRVRRIAAAHLRHWRLDLHVRPVCRALDELLTNVHQHVGVANSCVVELRWTGRRLTVSVADDSARMPPVPPADGGLGRVMALSDSWGTCRTEGGKVVWFTRYAEAPQAAGLLPYAPPPGDRTARGVLLPVLG